MKKIIYLSFGILLLNVLETHGTDAPFLSYLMSKKLDILNRIEDMFDPETDNYKLIQNLKFMLEEGISWEKEDEIAFSRLFNRSDVSFKLSEDLNTSSKSAKTSSPQQRKASSSWISPEEEERLTREMLAREEQERTDAEIARQLQEGSGKISAEEAERRTMAFLERERRTEQLNRAAIRRALEENRLEAERLSELAHRGRMNASVGQQLRELLPVPTSPEMKQNLQRITRQFFDVVQQNGRDFDVHKFDPVFGNGGFANNIDSPNCQTIIEYLNTFVPLEKAMTIEQIRERMTQDLKNSEQAFVIENDLSIEYLNRAFSRLNTARPHTNLINAFRQIYTMIYQYTQSWRLDMLVSFISNVNKFKGAECYQGFRNRMFAMFCLIYGHIRL